MQMKALAPHRHLSPIAHGRHPLDPIPLPACPWRLTAREAEVAALIARGWSGREIAGALGISLHTVRRHTERIFDKTGVRSRTRLIVLIGGGVGDGPALLRRAAG